MFALYFHKVYLKALYEYIHIYTNTHTHTHTHTHIYIYICILPPLGRSDHNLVQLKPLYISAVQWQPVTTRTVRRWSREAEETLQGCFEVTDWDVLCNAHLKDTDGLTDCITEYINFCRDNVIPTQTICYFPNNKP